MTHDLLSDMLEQLGASIVRITVTELRENTFYAQITVLQDGQEIEVDSRPSDAIALAIRAEAPIFAADGVIEESAIEFEGEEVDEEQLEAEVAEVPQLPRRRHARPVRRRGRRRRGLADEHRAARAPPPLKSACTNIPGTTLSVRSRSHASAMPNGTRTSSASTSPCESAERDADEEDRRPAAEEAQQRLAERRGTSAPRRTARRP